MASEKSDNSVKSVAAVAVIPALLAWPVYCKDKTLGAIASLLAAGGALYASWCVGQEKRGTNRHSLFAPTQTTFEKVNEAWEDVAAGSKAICDQVTQPASK